MFLVLLVDNRHGAESGEIVASGGAHHAPRVWDHGVRSHRRRFVGAHGPVLPKKKETINTRQSFKEQQTQE
jgi:hypothetical protein